MLLCPCHKMPAVKCTESTKTHGERRRQQAASDEVNSPAYKERLALSLLLIFHKVEKKWPLLGCCVFLAFLQHAAVFR